MGLIKKPNSARELAFNVLYKVEKQKAYANVLLEAAFVRTELSVRDRALTTELVYGVLRNRSWLDWVIKRCSNRHWEQISHPVKYILRLGIYQLLKLDRVSAYAAVDEAVKLARSCGEAKATGFVNALLRRVSRQAADVIDIPRKPLADYLANQYSHPKWLVERWLKRWGETETEALTKANNRQLPLTVRLNSLKASWEQLTQALTAQGFYFKANGSVAEALQIENAKQLAALPVYQNGWLEIEGLASMLAVQLLDPQPGESILDAASGRGVNTGHIAQLMGNRGQILALDNSPHKLKQLQRNCRRLGVDIVHSAAQDASRPLGFKEAYFDRILLDAPCSALGVIARYPECRWHRQAGDVTRLSKLQGDILKQAARYLKPGGVLVYSVCSFETEENEGVIQPFLQSNKDFVLDDLSPFLPADLKTHMNEDGCLRLLPHKWVGDGFFMARLLRKKSAH